MTLFNALLNLPLQWREPLLLWAILLPLIFWGVSRLIRKKQHQSYANSHLWPWVQGATTSVQTTSKYAYVQKILPPYPASLLLSLAWVCLIIALAGPRTLIETPDTQNREGVDLLVSMDLSHSMTATDRYPSRFLFAKSLIEAMNNQLEQADRLALQAFAGQPHIVNPLSHDHALFQHMLNLLEPNLLPRQGTWVERALIEGLEYLSQTDGQNRTLILFTNGAPEFWQPQTLPKHLQQSRFFRAANPLKTNAIKLIIVGVGQLNPVPLYNSNDPNKILHVNGKPVQSKLEETRLKKLTQDYGGVYLRAEPSPAFMQQLLTEITDKASEYPVFQARATWQDYAHPFMIAGLIFLLMAFYPLGRLRPKNNLTLLWLSGALSLSLYSVPQTSHAQTVTSPDPQILTQAYQAFQAQQYDQSLAQYQQLKGYQAVFGAGSSAYKLGHIETTVFYFRQAAWLANTDLERAHALFNLGNSYYQIQLFEFAISSYQQALIYQPNYTKAQHNLTLAQAQNIIQRQVAQKARQGKQGKGDGTQSPDTDGAFYGGQKPNTSNTNEAGFGSDGDAIEGEKQGNQVMLSDTEQTTHYQLPNAGMQSLFVNDYASQAKSAYTPQAKELVNQQQKQQSIARFKQKTQQLEDHQKILLKRLFEREAGFHAPQAQPHPIPGMQPW